MKLNLFLLLFQSVKKNIFLLKKINMFSVIFLFSFAYLLQVYLFNYNLIEMFLKR